VEIDLHSPSTSSWLDASLCSRTSLTLHFTAVSKNLFYVSTVILGAHNCGFKTHSLFAGSFVCVRVFEFAGMGTKMEMHNSMFSRRRIEFTELCMKRLPG
jgi:hypothetical protein